MGQRNKGTGTLSSGVQAASRHAAKAEPRESTAINVADDALARLAAIVESSDDAIIGLSLDGKVLSWNAAAERMYGFPAEEMLGRELTAVIPENRLSSEKLVLLEVTAGRKVEHYETVRKHRNGSLFDVSLTISPIRDQSGTVVGVSKIARDISSRKESERALNENRIMLAMAMQSSRMGAWERDIATGTIYWSEELESIFGLGKGEFRNSEEHFYELIHEDDREQIWHEIEAATVSRRPHSIEFRFYHKDGSVRWLEGRGEAVYSETGEPVRLYGIGIDVTERKLEAEARKQAEDELRMVSRMPAENPNPVIRLGRDGTILYFNESAAPMLEAWDHTIPADLMERVREAYRSRVKREIEIEYAGRTVSCTLVPFPDAGYINIYGTDITSRKLAVEALRESEQRFSRFMQYLPGLAWIKDAEGRYVYANESAERSFGIPRAKLYGRNDEEVFPPESAAQFIEHDRRAVESGTGIQVLESLVEDDGVTHYSIVSKFPISGPDGRTALIGGMAIDVTEQKQAEEDLRRRMEFDEAVMTNMGEGLYTVDALGQVTSMNPAAENLLGWTFEEVRGQKIHEVVHFKKRDGSPFPAEECAGLSVFEEGKLLVNYEDVFIRKDGTFFDVMFSSSPLWEKGVITGLVVVFQDISERKRAAEALERYRHLSEYASDMIWLLKADGQIVEVNQAAVETYGYTNEEFLTMNVRDLRTPFAPDTVHEQLDAAAAGSVTFETEHVRKDGTVLPVEVNASSADFDGERLIMSIVRDVTERKRLEKDHELLFRLSDLVRTENNTETILDTAVRVLGSHLELDRCFLSSIDLERETSTVLNEYKNETLEPLVATARFSDYSAANLKAALVGRTIVVSNTAKDERTADKYTAGYRRDQIGSYVAVPLERDGTWAGMFFACRQNAHEWSESEIALVQTVAERVWLAVEKLRSEAALRDSERRAVEEYQSLLERIVPLAETLGGARELVSVYRALHEFICASMSCSGFFVSFYDAERSVRLPAYVWGEGEEIDVSTLPPMPITREGGPNSEAILSKRTIITDGYWTKQQKRPHLVLKDTGVDPMSSLVVPMVVQDRVIGTLEVQAHQDRSFQREHAIALEMAANLAAVAIDNVRLLEVEAKARSEAESANRMKDEFLSVLSHELRTPLNAMLGWVRILRSGHVNEERIAKALEIIERNTRQQSSLIEDLLDVSRIISGKMRIEHELIDLSLVLEQAAENVRSLAVAKGVDFQVGAAVEALYVRGDAVRLQQVVTNLLQNAIKFTPAGGKVSLEYSIFDQEAVITVADTGMGIDPAFLPDIFDRFSQADVSTRRNNTGLGLGLTIVSNIVELHGGRTVAHSAGLGKGATFTVRIPLANEYYQAAAVTVPMPVSNDASDALAGLKILVVDDDVDGLVPLRIMLESESAKVATAASASDALEKLRKDDFDILISDIGMPTMDGFELIGKLRKDKKQRNHAIKAIACTAYASEDDRSRALASGYQVHLAKPLDFEELIAIVRNFGNGIHARQNN